MSRAPPINPLVAEDRRDWREWAAALEGVAWLATVRLALALLPYRITSRSVELIARVLAGVPRDSTASDDAAVARAVRRASRIVGDSKCLPLAIAGMMLASRRGLRSRVQIGVRVGANEPFGAHAWLETSAGTPIGGREAAAFTPLTTLDPFGVVNARAGHRQRIHGLTIVGDTELPGISPAHGAIPDVTLRVVSALGPPPPEARLRYRSPGAADSADATLEVHQDDGGIVQFRYSDGTAFDVELDGRSVRVDAVIGRGQTLEDMTVYLYGPVLGYVLRALDRLALHASSVVIEGRAIAFLGGSGAGKSTTAAALGLRGATLLSDDLTALSDDEGAWIAHRAFDHARVWSSSEPLLYGSSGVLEPITPGWDKLRVPFAQDGAGDCPLGVMYLLEWSDDDEAARFTTVAGRDALLALTTHTYSNYLLTPAQKAVELESLAALLSDVPVRRLVRSRRSRSLDEMCEAIERDVRGAVGSMR